MRCKVTTRIARSHREIKKERRTEGGEREGEGRDPIGSEG